MISNFWKVIPYNCLLSKSPGFAFTTWLRRFSVKGWLSVKIEADWRSSQLPKGYCFCYITLESQSVNPKKLGIIPNTSQKYLRLCFRYQDSKTRSKLDHKAWQNWFYNRQLNSEDKNLWHFRTTRILPNSTQKKTEIKDIVQFSPDTLPP